MNKAGIDGKMNQETLELIRRQDSDLKISNQKEKKIACWAYFIFYVTFCWMYFE